MIRPTKPVPIVEERLTLSLFEQRLDIKGLTAIRFFPAALVVFYHARDYFQCWYGQLEGLVFAQAVSFFFILSGFVLTLNYFHLRGTKSALQFYLARYARMWPAHIISLSLLILILPELFRITADKIPVFIANVFMLQSFVPSWKWYFSFNAPSWSNSTEVFFYLVFPLLVVLARRHWFLPLALSTVALTTMIAICSLCHLPECDSSGPSIQGLVYVGPLSRSVEFVIGMLAALLFHRYKTRRNDAGEQVFLPGAGSSLFAGTVLEITAIAVAFTAIGLAQPIRAWTYPVIGNAASLWLQNSGLGLVGFSLLIFVFALAPGLLSRLLSLPWLVALGEMSFAMYMLHCVFIAHRSVYYPHDQSTTSLLLFILALMLSSHFLWLAVEKPLRKLILSAGNLVVAGKGFGNGFSLSFFQSVLGSKKAVWIVTEGLLLVLVVYLMLPTVRQVSARELSAFVLSPTCQARNVCFGDTLCLRGAQAVNYGDKATVTLFWQNLLPGKLNNYVAVKVLDPSGRQIQIISYMQDCRKRQFPAKVLFREQFDLHALRIPAGSKLAVSARAWRHKILKPEPGASGLTVVNDELVMPLAGMK